MRKRACTHGLSDDVEVVNRIVVENYRYRCRSTVFGYWCPAHQAFGSHTVTEDGVQFPARESTAPPVSG